jgi:hypothetical protein
MSIYMQVYNELRAKIEHLPKYNTKIAKSVFNKLDEEAIYDIILDGNTFWFEHATYEQGMSNKQYQWLIKYLEQKGYRYLYE